MQASSLNLVVVRASDLERTRIFYSGPVHYACDFGKVVLEFYPAEMIAAGIDHVRLGFDVDSLSRAVDSVRALGYPVATLPAKQNMAT